MRNAPVLAGVRSKDALLRFLFFFFFFLFAGVAGVHGRLERCVTASSAAVLCVPTEGGLCSVLSRSAIIWASFFFKGLQEVPSSIGKSRPALWAQF